MFAKLTVAASGLDQFAAELRGLDLIGRLAHVPTPTPVASGLADVEGGSLLLFEAVAERPYVGQMTPSGTTTYPLTPGSQPGAITTGPDGNLWLGGLSPRAPADAVIYDADPRADLAQLDVPQAVVLRGQLAYRRGLRRGAPHAARTLRPGCLATR